MFLTLFGGIDRDFEKNIIDLYLWYRSIKIMTKQKQQTLINFKKAQSHVAKIIEMVEKGEYCIDVMQQNMAVIGLLKSAHQMLMEGHLNSCFKNAMSSKNEKRKQEMIDEILRVSKLSNK